ncbi:MAG TPA: bifunctional demethylmenaquinone methyltransferase/2-methoxy-6-polyprenyl-1,4-benzoquinol methylase UbiE [Ferruginibacter sp.]|jgi:demethylmenaquinone methyltransferase/2-methoxy-6-polyprenyl-1,4-benzoquinol methylase|nr:bifunctional demethylmenaquinone methyltransferase/2-methoxy-6-polyprenyl-1,4-benzoquinol methylase UbiE [Ferruginibacter sp.]HRO05423.1 bifunctional demethylmenaquinone methyltransferase/2-methoxy-6-polyprenyl-1,4-benzoquinol methylase UbiE [Ferruginibacter sp.]HRO96139.1 bifunctional demethylmenaquinone methyltransferase/2-methoxy-6-polyprenyl-1,4-benzoquinol methylase UbiE [Ferruginibacter sp.]HRP48900.1 bifunctional demethylmenaquinone methyltransferase/2-methoxy-6-polyprenyl-1,4-benzoqui
MAQYAHDQVVPNRTSGLEKKEQVEQMFDHIAGNYDFLNRSMSMGIDKGWRKKAILKLKASSPQHILDVATGTADVAIMASRLLKPEHIKGIDISEGMLEVGRKKVRQAGLSEVIELLKGDSETINFNDNTFDAVTVAFGVRNFQHLEKGLAEIRRVLKPGGKLVVLEFSKPTSPLYKPFYQLYMKTICPLMAHLFSKSSAAYEYLDESIDKFPEGKNFTRVLESVGFRNTSIQKMTFGICSIYCGEK